MNSFIMNRCCLCDGEYEFDEPKSIQVYDLKVTYGVLEDVVAYNFCPKECLKKCYEEEKDPLLKEYLWSGFPLFSFKPIWNICIIEYMKKKDEG